MKKPIKIPRNLKRGDVVVCNHGEQLMVSSYFNDGKILTSEAKDSRRVWKPDGRNYSTPNERWIVAIERKTDEKPEKAKKHGREWCVVIRCTSRKHAREVRTNIDNGLRKITIEQRIDKGTSC